MENKTGKAQINAVTRYNQKFDRCAVNLPKGTKDKIKALTGKSINVFINELVKKELDQIEFKKNDVPF